MGDDDVQSISESINIREIDQDVQRIREENERIRIAHDLQRLSDEMNRVREAQESRRLEELRELARQERLRLATVATSDVPDALAYRPSYQDLEAMYRDHHSQTINEYLASLPSLSSNVKFNYKKERILFCTYFTLETPYEKVAYEMFVKSPYFEQIDSRDVYLKGLKNEGSWTANTALKPRFILDTMAKFSDVEYFVFVDADSKIMRRPDFLFELMKTKVDLAFHRLDWQTWYQNGIDRKELLSGTILIKNCHATRTLCEEWHRRALATKMWEQKVLENLLDERKDLTIAELPVEYCYINSLPDGREPFVKIENPVIVHYQASRTLRKQIHE